MPEGQTNVKKAVYVQVEDVKTYRMGARRKTLKRDLLSSEHLDISQTIIEGCGSAEDYGTSGVDRMQYVLEGAARLRQGGRETEVVPGDLVVVPRGASWGPDLFVKSDRLTLLEIAPREADGGTKPAPDVDQEEAIRVIRPQDVEPYQPAGHAKTVNRCLFQNEQVEIIEGSIEVGGGADEHLHEEHEQMLYVLEGSDRPVLIYYPKGTLHGTGGGVAAPLKLVVIYSPPLGEARQSVQSEGTENP
jgi:quercetin dioxygenase-like cupin family protein